MVRAKRVLEDIENVASGIGEGKISYEDAGKYLFDDLAVDVTEVLNCFLSKVDHE